MNRRRITPIVVLLIVSVILATMIAITPGEAALSWDTIADGVDYTMYTIDTIPARIHVARMDRSKENLILDSMLGQGRISGGVEQVSGMAERYDQSLTTWGGTFGNRSNVLVAINGFYFGAPEEDAGVPWAGQIQNGWQVKQFLYPNNPAEFPSAFGWKNNDSVFIGNGLYYVDNKQYVDFESDEGEDGIQFFHGINRARGSNEVILYTSQFDRTTMTNSNGVEVIVQMDTPATLALARNAAIGTVIEIRENQGNTTIAFDQIVISASGNQADQLLENLDLQIDDERPGIQVAIAQKINESENDWEGTFAGIGAAFHFLENGEVDPNSHDTGATSRHPRTAIAYNDNYIYFIVVDGRFEGVSEGMTIQELGEFAQDTLSATDGISLDGGGSSTMWVDGQVVNIPSDQCPGVLLPMIMKNYDGEASSAAETEVPDQEASAVLFNGCQRWVANGMMMVEVEEEVKSNTYSYGDPFQVTGDEWLRLGPGNNYNPYQLLDMGTDGGVITHTKGIDGVQATGDYWWYVDVDGARGWLRESAITPTLLSLEQDGGKFEKPHLGSPVP